MSDMLSPLQWEPATEPGDVAPEEPPPPRPFPWPTPPFLAYPAMLPLRPAEACEIEGLNGRHSSGRLGHFDAQLGVMHVQVPPSRSTLPLRFEHFRCLRLLTPVEPHDLALDGTPHSALARQRPRTRYRLNFRDGVQWQGETIGREEQECGLFLFHPIDADDRVQRVFVPCTAILDFQVEPAADGAPPGPQPAAQPVPQPVPQPELPPEIDTAIEPFPALQESDIGGLLLARRVTTPEALDEAIAQQSRMPMVRIGEALISLGLVSDQQLAQALEQQQLDRSVPLGQLLIRAGAVSQQDLQGALARKMGYPVVDVLQFPCDIAAIRKLNYATARRLNALPLMLRGGRLVVALEDPAQPQVIDEIEFASQLKVVPVLAPWSTLEEAMRIAYERAGATLSAQTGAVAASADVLDYEPSDTNQLVASLEREGADEGREEDKPIEQSDNSLVRLINNTIIEAAADGVSDIHIECHPGREKVRIRFRKDGVLRQHLELPHNYRSALIARIKIMCDLDISERRKPQDGKINFARFSPSHRIELRVATIPTNNGVEDVVMRILASAKPLPLARLGLSPRNLRVLSEATGRPYGLILCVGPTGSGKTTTLHSALSHINTPERKIWTAEDPIEITQAGLRQVQVNPKIDWTFAKALRAFLRADPDVIMVGEIRDGETARMAIEASLTGHLVLSTLHTNSAPETVTRLLDMGMDPFNFADSLLLVLAQRLVRRMCPDCRSAQPASQAEVDELLSDHLHATPKEVPEFAPDRVLADWIERFGQDGRLVRWQAAGCKACGHSGFRGRAGLHELMVSNRALRRLVQTGARAEQLQHEAMLDGMRTLRQDGIEKVWQGLTTIDEVRAMSNA